MYVTIELRTDFDGKFTVSQYKKETRGEADKAFHSILSGAATSSTLAHAAVILNQEGNVLDQRCYKHNPPEPEPEVEPEVEPETANEGDE